MRVGVMLAVCCSCAAGVRAPIAAPAKPIAAPAAVVMPAAAVAVAPIAGANDSEAGDAMDDDDLADDPSPLPCLPPSSIIYGALASSNGHVVDACVTDGDGTTGHCWTIDPRAARSTPLASFAKPPPSTDRDAPAFTASVRGRSLRVCAARGARCTDIALAARVGTARVPAQVAVNAAGTRAVAIYVQPHRYANPTTIAEVFDVRARRRVAHLDLRHTLPGVGPYWQGVSFFGDDLLAYAYESSAPGAYVVFDPIAKRGRVLATDSEAHAAIDLGDELAVLSGHRVTFVDRELADVSTLALPEAETSSREQSYALARAGDQLIAVSAGDASFVVVEIATHRATPPQKLACP